MKEKIKTAEDIQLPPVSLVFNGEDNELHECLEREKAYFENPKVAAAKVELQNEEAIEDVQAAKLHFKSRSLFLRGKHILRGFKELGVYQRELSKEAGLSESGGSLFRKVLWKEQS